MARTKGKSKIRVAGRQAPVATEQDSSVSLKDYVVINLVFTGFCLLQLVIVRMILRDYAGVNFFFGFLIVAFAIVSLFDYFAMKLKLGNLDDSDELTTND